MRVTVLGSGHSGGTPMVGEGWGKCDPKNPKNRRLRPSILVESGGTRILVDTSPDLRAQMLKYDFDRLDAVLYTHAHADHLHGIDELRGVNRAMGQIIPAYADQATRDVIGARFPYVLTPLREDATIYYKPCLEIEVIAPGDVFSLGGVEIQVMDQDHGFMRTLGYRFGNFAYSTDLVEMPEQNFDILDGIETWMVGSLWQEPHVTHAHVDKAVEWAKRVGAKRTVLTHLSHRLDYGTLRKALPEGIEPAYDGMVLEVNEDR
ncbi:MAG: MBL fold metallo-hydrolase [Rhodospirillales bacterium]|nr:MBL fold metallo-hydrolase [Rhodospirillales bacterium]